MSLPIIRSPGWCTSSASNGTSPTAREGRELCIGGGNFDLSAAGANDYGKQRRTHARARATTTFATNTRLPRHSTLDTRTDAERELTFFVCCAELVVEFATRVAHHVSQWSRHSRVERLDGCRTTNALAKHGARQHDAADRAEHNEQRNEQWRVVVFGRSELW